MVVHSELSASGSAHGKVEHHDQPMRVTSGQSLTDGPRVAESGSLITIVNSCSRGAGEGLEGIVRTGIRSLNEVP